MGKTKIKTIDLSQPEGKQAAKLERNKAVGEVEHKEAVETPEDFGAKQAHSEPSGQASGALAPSEQPKKAEKIKSGQKQKSKKQRSKKYQQAKELIDPSKKYPLNEAIDIAQKSSYSKFNGTIEAHINTTQTGLRGFCSLPYASGKKLRILVFGHLPSPEEYEGVVFGDDSTIDEILSGKFRPSGIDIIVTTPDWMSKLTKAAKILGPKSLMPNPKNGTITDNLSKTIQEFQGGKTEYKTENNRKVIHLGVGKVEQSKEEIVDNIKVIYNTLGRSKIQKITLSATMGPGVKVDLSSI